MRFRTREWPWREPLCLAGIVQLYVCFYMNGFLYSKDYKLEHLPIAERFFGFPQNRIAALGGLMLILEGLFRRRASNSKNKLIALWVANLGILAFMMNDLVCILVTANMNGVISIIAMFVIYPALIVDAERRCKKQTGWPPGWTTGSR